MASPGGFDDPLGLCGQRIADKYLVERLVGEGGYADAQAAAAAFAASGAPAAVICGTDAAYAEQGVAYAKALKEAGAGFIYLAGRAGDAQAEYEAAGIDDFVYMGVDVLSTLQRLHTTLGVQDGDRS